MDSTQIEKKKGISGSTLKIIAIVIMLIDHVAAVVLARMIMASGYTEEVINGNSESVMLWLMENNVLYYGYDIMRSIGRLAFPIFCFLLVEGYRHTRNAKKYALRLGVFALVSEVPFDLALTGTAFEPEYQNVFFTLFLGLAALCAFDYFAKKELHRVFEHLLAAAGVLSVAAFIASGLANAFYIYDLWSILGAFVIFAVVLTALFVYWGKKKGMRYVQVLGADMAAVMLAMTLADLMCTDYSGWGVLTIVAMYIFRSGRLKSMTAGCVALNLMSSSELTAFLALIPVALYNGKRGMKMKYFFYLFYPVHLLLLYLISVLMGLGGVAIF